MRKISIDNNYNLIKIDSNIYNDEVGNKIDIIIEAIGKKIITKEEGAELLQVVIPQQIKQDINKFTTDIVKTKKRKNPFILLLNYSSFIERYAN